eukprot:11248636-Karenia_brevis.AAC.1
MKQPRGLATHLSQRALVNAGSNRSWIVRVICDPQIWLGLQVWMLSWDPGLASNYDPQIIPCYRAGSQVLPALATRTSLHITSDSSLLHSLYSALVEHSWISGK